MSKSKKKPVNPKKLTYMGQELVHNTLYNVDLQDNEGTKYKLLKACVYNLLSNEGEESYILHNNPNLDGNKPTDDNVDEFPTPGYNYSWQIIQGGKDLENYKAKFIACEKKTIKIKFKI